MNGEPKVNLPFIITGVTDRSRVNREAHTIFCGAVGGEIPLP